MKLSHLAAAVFVVALFGLQEYHYRHELDRLEDRAHALEDQTRALLLRENPAPVAVTCVCPEYEEGWDDAEYAEGCDPSMAEMPIEELRMICEELETFGYVPHC